MANYGVKPFVLVVDDTPANLVAMRAVLSPLDVELVEASSGAEALARAKEHAYAVALLDVQMPIMDGFELARRLRAMPECKELPIIFLTAIHRDERYVHEGYATGAADYLTKPIDPEILRARVKAFVELFRQRDRLRVEQLTALLESERAARHEAEVANAAKDEFIAIASHELRTPLTAILGWAVLARKLPPGPSLDSALETIERNARAEKRLVDDLLDMTRSMSGKLRLEIDDVSVDEAVASAVTSFELAAANKGVHIEADAHAGAIRADGHRVKQIVSNLVANAIKFTPHGGGVYVSATRDDSSVVLSVRDTGEGIPAEFLHRIFEPFSQADTSPSREHGGLGLGLAIAKQLVLAHGGNIRAESAGRGRGATFVVELPLESVGR